MRFVVTKGKGYLESGSEAAPCVECVEHEIEVVSTKNEKKLLWIVEINSLLELQKFLFRYNPVTIREASDVGYWDVQDKQYIFELVLGTRKGLLWKWISGIPGGNNQNNETN